MVSSSCSSAFDALQLFIFKWWSTKQSAAYREANRDAVTCEQSHYLLAKLPCGDEPTPALRWQEIRSLLCWKKGIVVCCVGLRICCRPELSRRMSSFVEDLGGFFLQWACQLLRSVTVRWFKGEVEASKEATTLPHLLYSRMVIKEAESCSFLPLFKWFIGLSESSNWL